MKLAKKPVGTIHLCNWGGLEVLSINNEEVVACFNFGNGREMFNTHKIIYTSSGRAYFRKQGKRYYLDQITKAY